MSEGLPVSDDVIEAKETINSVSGILSLVEDESSNGLHLKVNASVGNDGVVRSVSDDIKIRLETEFYNDFVGLGTLLDPIASTVRNVLYQSPGQSDSGFDQQDFEGYVEMRKEDINEALAAGRLKIVLLRNTEKTPHFKIEILKILDDEKSGKLLNTKNGSDDAPSAKQISEEPPKVQERKWWTRGKIGNLLGKFFASNE